MKVDKIDSKMSDRKGLTGDRIGWQKLCTNWLQHQDVTQTMFDPITIHNIEEYIYGVHLNNVVIKFSESVHFGSDEAIRWARLCE